MVRKYNYYPTGSSLTNCLLSNTRHNNINDGYVLECCSGDKHISNVLIDRGHNVITNDINPDTEADFHLDMTNRDSWLTIQNSLDGYISYVITNPPYSSDPPPGKKRGKPIAHEIFNLAMEYSIFGTSMLLRSSFTEPCSNRHDILVKYADNLDVIIYLPRYSFTGDSNTDLVSCNWYCYKKTPQVKNNINTKTIYINKKQLCCYN